MSTASARTPTAFEARVYDALCRIPAGRVTTYKHLARAIGCGSSQAVGQALRRNPFAPRVPCHRVIRNDLTPGGYSGESGGRQLALKLALLAEEGVRFENGRLAPGQSPWEFDDA